MPRGEAQYHLEPGLRQRGHWDPAALPGEFINIWKILMNLPGIGNCFLQGTRATNNYFFLFLVPFASDRGAGRRHQMESATRYH